MNKNLQRASLLLLCVATFAACNHGLKQKTIECDVSPVEVFGYDYSPQDLTFHSVLDLDSSAWEMLGESTGNNVYPNVYVSSNDTAAVAQIAADYCRSLANGAECHWQRCVGSDAFELVIIDSKTLLDGSCIIEASAVMNYYGQPEVDITFNDEAAAKWKIITCNHIGKRIAMMLKDHVLSSPMVAGEIDCGKASIVGPSQEEICALCKILESKK